MLRYSLLSDCGGGRDIYKLIALRVGDTSINWMAVGVVGDQKKPPPLHDLGLGQPDMYVLLRCLTGVGVSRA